MVDGMSFWLAFTSTDAAHIHRNRALAKKAVRMMGRVRKYSTVEKNSMAFLIRNAPILILAVNSAVVQFVNKLFCVFFPWLFS